LAALQRLGGVDAGARTGAFALARPDASLHGAESVRTVSGRPKDPALVKELDDDIKSHQEQK